MPLVASNSLRPLLSQPGKWAIPAHLLAGRRVGGYKYISIQQTPATDSARIEAKGKTTSASSPDATFEILGQPYSLLSVSLSPSQDLHTRRGTLVGLHGDPDTVVSTLRILNPIRRALIGIPFLYQRITSTTPISALISTKSTTTSLAILQLDGTTDWKLAQRKALVAWTGKTLSVAPSINNSLSVAYWGSSDVTGRGLLALAGSGQIYAIDLAQGESYTVHPANILAYTTSGTSTTTTTPLPKPFRFKSSQIRFQIPLALGNWFPDSKFIRTMKTSNAWRFISRISLRLKTWSRRTIWGDRLFLRFEGPTTILVQSRASRVSEVLTNEDINEIADAEPGVLDRTIRGMRKAEDDRSRMGVHGATVSAQTSPVPAAIAAATASTPAPTSSPASESKDTKLKVTSVSDDGKATFEAVSTKEEKK